jgi:hypothetical protein
VRLPAPRQPTSTMDAWGSKTPSFLGGAMSSGTLAGSGAHVSDHQSGRGSISIFMRPCEFVCLLLVLLLKMPVVMSDEK